jgi:CheY-like chemotaxis protein
MAEGKRVLIVEDETLTAMALGSYLEERGYSVVGICATGEDALQAAREGDPDLILMDIRLAGKMDGIEAARLINLEAPRPIVFISGYASRSFHDSDFQPIAYLSKPIDYGDLELILESAKMGGTGEA